MKKIIASVLTLAFLSGGSVNISFAEEIQLAETAQEKALNMLNNNDKNDVCDGLDNTSKNETIDSEVTNKPANPIKNNANKKSAREKSIEKIKNDIEKKQKLIQKYENMTDKKFSWRRVLLATIKSIGVLFLMSCSMCAIGIALLRNFELGYYSGYSAGYTACYESNLGRHSFSQSTDGNSAFLSEAKTFVRKLLSTFHPDTFKQAKTFDDVKELYYLANNFYDDYLK